jgi:hypothetical protein
MNEFIRSYYLTALFVIAFAISIPLFALYGSGVLTSLQILLLILGSSGPAIAAMVVARVSGDRSALITWLFIGSRGSVPICALFHAVYNTCGLILLAGGPIRALLTAETLALLVLVVILLVRYSVDLTSYPSTSKDFSAA